MEVVPLHGHLPRVLETPASPSSDTEQETAR